MYFKMIKIVTDYLSVHRLIQQQNPFQACVYYKPQLVFASFTRSQCLFYIFLHGWHGAGRI